MYRFWYKNESKIESTEIWKSRVGEMYIVQDISNG